MNLTTPVQLAFKSLRAQKTRSILTMLGVSIGIGVVIAIMAAGRGLDKMILGQLEVFSPNMLTIDVKVPSAKKTSPENAIGQATGITITTIKDKDLEAVRKHPNIAAAYGMVMGQAVVKYQGESKTSILVGEGYNVPEVEKFILASGRMFTKEEEESLAQVAVITPVIKESLFGDDDPIGKTIYIKGKSFRVIGSRAKQGAVFGFDMDNIVILPTKTMQKRILGIDYMPEIMAKVKDGGQIKQTVADLEEIIRANHDITDLNKDDFSVSTMAEAMKMLATVVDGITFLLVALVCISLLVGGVGIMNIMYVSVTERTFEIGLRKAVGATSRDILWQFLSEAILITTVGGLAGIVIGAILALIIYLIAIYYNFIWVYSIPIASIFLAIGFSAAVGLFFGIYPARRAAQLDPVEALRQE
ncbi:MAG: ABC transporter permease [Patescibacteria group bacterium]